MPQSKYKLTIRKVLIPIGPSIAYVPLSRGLYALIDSSDAEWAGQWNWSTLEGGKKGYERYFMAIRREYSCISHKRPTILMHTSILGLTGTGLTADHIRPGNMLDNRRANLRPANKSQQAINKRLYRNNTSGYKGVSWNKPMNKWGAYIRINGRHTLLGWYVDKVEAYAAYCEAARKHHGEFANI